MPSDSSSEGKWNLPDYMEFFAAVQAQTRGTRELTLGELFSAPTTPGQDAEIRALTMEYARKAARHKLDATLRLEYSPGSPAGQLAFPEDHWEVASIPFPPARDARGVAELAAPGLSAADREHRIEAFRDAAAFYAELADALEARLAAESGIRRLK